MTKNILAAVDGSAPSAKALKLAAQLARSADAKLVIVTVMSGRPLLPDELEASSEGPGLHAAVVEPAFATSPGEGYSAILGRSVATAASDRAQLAAAQRLLTAAAFEARQAGAPAVETVVESGDPADRILSVAKSRSPELIVVGSRGLSKWAERLLGGVSQEIMRKAPCAVLVVEPSETER